MAVLPNIGAALFSKLTSDSGVLAIANNRVYAMQAPASTPMPYLVFDIVSGGIPNIVPKDTLNYLMTVHSWSNVHLVAVNLHLAVYTALHEQSLTVSGWSPYWLVCEREQRFVENYTANQYYHLVWDIRFKASKD